MQEKQAAKVLGPQANTGTDALKHTLKVLAVTTSSAVHDIIGAPLTHASGVLPKAEGRFVTMISDVDLYYVWSDDGSGAIDETKTGSTDPDEQCMAMAAGERISEYPQGRYLILKGANAGVLRLAVSSP